MIIDQCKDKVPAELPAMNCCCSVRYHVEVRLDHLTTQNTDTQLHRDNAHNKHILSREGEGVEGEREAGAARLGWAGTGGKRKWERHSESLSWCMGWGGGGGGGG